MSARRVARVLARLSAGGAVLLLQAGGRDYGVATGRDQRRRALLKLSAAEVRTLEAEGALEARGADEFGLSAAGFARVAREAAAPGEAFMAQHGDVVARDVIDAEGGVRRVRGLDSEVVMRKLAALKGPNGEAWLSAAELSAAGRLRADWIVGEGGLVRVSDWTAAPMGSTARGPGNAQEAAMARRCDARRHTSEALARLAAPLRRVVESVCLHERGLETLERDEGWPARSGKLALKLGLAQLAAAL